VSTRIYVADVGQDVGLGGHFGGTSDGKSDCIGGEKRQAWRQALRWGGLRLDVDKNGNRSWVFRYTSPTTGKERYAGFGSASEVTLAEARDARDEARKLIRNNIDPIENRISERAKAQAAETGVISFEGCAKQYIAGKEAGWKNEKHRQQWSNSLRDYAYPIIGSIAVPDVDTAAVLLKGGRRPKS